MTMTSNLVYEFLGEYQDNVILPHGQGGPNDYVDRHFVRTRYPYVEN